MGQEFHFGDFTLDQARFQLQKGGRLVRLEKRPMELLILLVERRGELVSREEIAQRLWGRNVFLDVDHGINTAIRKVRQALRDDPEKPRFLETVVGKGYCFAAPVISNNGNQNPQPEPIHSAVPIDSVPASQSPEQKSTSLRPWLVLGAIVLAALALAVVLYRGRTTKGKDQPAIKSIAVLPLKNLSGDSTQEYLADGMTEELIGRLSGIHGLRVISRTSVMHFKDTQLSVPEIAKALNVDALVEGSVIREGNRIRVHAQLIRTATDEHFWSQTYERNLQDVLALQSDVADAIANKVEVSVTGRERARLVAARPVSPEAYESTLKGSYNDWNSEADIEKSIGYFQDAIKIDPTYALPYLGLGSAYLAQGSIMIGDSPQEAHQKVVSAAKKALELDPELADAHLLLADVKQKQYQWAVAEAEYKRALELAPNDASAHFALAEWLSWQGRAEEALAWARRGRELDPLSVSGDDMGVIYYNARRYEEAIQEYRGVLAVRPDEANALWGMGIVLLATHQPQQSIPALEKALSVAKSSPGVAGSLVAAYAQTGRRKEALRLLDELKKREQPGYAGAFVHAYLGLGDYDQTFSWLEQGYKEQSNIMQHLKVDPMFDPVRGDPRFQDLLRRVGLS